MGTVVLLAVDIDPAQGIIEAFLRRNPNLPSGASKAAQTQADGINAGYKAGIAAALQVIGTEERLERWREMYEASTEERYMPAVEVWEVEKFLSGARDAYKDWNPEHLEESEFWEGLMASWAEVVFDEDTSRMLEERRRKLVLENLRDPEPSDEGWLLEHAENFRAVAQPYERAIAKLRELQ